MLPPEKKKKHHMGIFSCLVFKLLCMEGNAHRNFNLGNERIYTNKIRYSFFKNRSLARFLLAMSWFFLSILILQVPFLVDPNTGARIGDYKNILAYLFTTYSAGAT